MASNTKTCTHDQLRAKNNLWQALTLLKVAVLSWNRTEINKETQKCVYKLRYKKLYKDTININPGFTR